MRNFPSTIPIPSLPSPPHSATKTHDGIYESFKNNATAPRVKTDAVIVEALRKQYPNLRLTICPTYECILLTFAATGHAEATSVDEDNTLSENLKYRMYSQPAKRTGGYGGYLYDVVQFGKYLYKWEGKDYLVYIVVGQMSSSDVSMTYILGPTAEANNQLMLSVCKWMEDTTGQVLVYDHGYWQGSTELWRSVQDSNWKDVILDEGMKKSIVGEVEKFFSSEEKYRKLKVPWKRGIIFHGPPGNGKTISIKAMMHTLYLLPDPIPTLYVRSLTSWQGPEASLSAIFSGARRMAPCFLVFEDLDSIVTDNVRSYFLNEVDGLQNNDGILMVGSTNHLERLDPGISKRPSRFDRKYLFHDPNEGERRLYCQYWRGKLADNEDIEFPEVLEEAIARITKGFSFAYIQEAFVAALLVIANGEADEEDAILSADLLCLCGEDSCRSCRLATLNEKFVCDGDDLFYFKKENLDNYVLWREIKKVVKNLRDELDI